jgi:hypothetical protein
LEGFRRLNTFNARSDKSPQNSSLSANGFPALSERGQDEDRTIIQRDDGRYQIGLTDDAPGPFPTRAFAESVAAHEAVRAVLS